MKLFRATSLLETEGCESCKAVLAACTICYVLDRIIHVQSSNLIFSTILWKNSHFSCLCLLKSSSAISFLQAICFAAKEEKWWPSVVTNLFFERIRIPNLIHNLEIFRIRIRILFVVRKFSNPNPNIQDSGKKIRIWIRIWRNILVIQIIE